MLDIGSGSAILTTMKANTYHIELVITRNGVGSVYLRREHDQECFILETHQEPVAKAYAEALAKFMNVGLVTRREPVSDTPALDKIAPRY